MPYISKAEREKIPIEDFGVEKGRLFPIRNQQDLDDAEHLVGKHPEAKSKIIAIAKRKKLVIPKSWADTSSFSDPDRAREAVAVARQIVNADEQERTADALMGEFLGLAVLHNEVGELAKHSEMLSRQTADFGAAPTLPAKPMDGKTPLDADGNPKVKPPTPEQLWNRYQETRDRITTGRN